MRAAVLVCALAAPACSLIIDTEAVRARREAGGARTLGEVDAGPLDGLGRGDAGPLDDLGRGDAATPEALASPCGRAGVSGLRCDAPVRLVRRGQGSGLASLAGMTGGFVAAVVEGTTVVTRWLDLRGDVRSMEQTHLAAPPSDLRATAHGAHWAVGFVSDAGRSLRCISSLPGAESSTLTPPTPVRNLALAIGPTGVIALGALLPDTLSTSFFRSVSTSPGCPTRGENTQPAYYVLGAAAMRVPGAAPDAFRFAVSAVQPDLLNSVVAAVEPMGTRIAWQEVGGLGLRGVEIAPTSDGVYMLVAYGAYDEGGDHFGVWLTAHRVDLGTPPQINRQLASDVTDFDLSECGAGCRVVAYVAGEGRGRVTATFVSDDVSLTTLGTVAEYDVACLPSAVGAGVDVASSSERVAFLITQEAQVDLYVCDLPGL
ncbi:MAG: hypothetical protein IT384_27450 [Deltaproteobacteria bacterium]|nr:hypothetical protein [Deltaproteobacteria bacterium]